MWTGVVLAQPRFDAVEMEPVSARQYSHLGIEFHGIHANRALRRAIWSHHLPSHSLLGQRVNGRVCGWWWSRALLGMVDQLRYHPIELFLRVDSIAIAVHVHQSGEH